MGTYSLSNVQLLEPICLFIMVGRYLELSINLSKGILIKKSYGRLIEKRFCLPNFNFNFTRPVYISPGQMTYFRGGASPFDSPYAFL